MGHCKQMTALPQRPFASPADDALEPARTRMPADAGRWSQGLTAAPVVRSAYFGLWRWFLFVGA
ncbi:MAG: hypothetical protein FJW39_27065 [Acidobacteria bacterium]|nr:hypothetical protein [Acidobacteriota bacterium]